MSRPLFAHQLEALLLLEKMRDEELLGRTVKRRKSRSEERLDAPIGSTGIWQTDIDWFAPSCIVDWSRGVANFRIPFVGLTSISRCDVPRSADGQTHPRYPDQRKASEAHFGYIARQDREFRTAYIERPEARDQDDAGHYQHVLSNISRNPRKRREFVRKVTEFEQKPHAPTLWAWSSDLAFWEQAAAADQAPLWVRNTASLVRAALDTNAVEQSNPENLKAFRVSLGETDPEEAYERLLWCDLNSTSEQLPPLDFESKSGGRIQYRLVFELPFGLSAKERFQIARAMARWCKEKGFMYVIAIHQPDGHNDSRNFHIHCDFYDRPCRWLKAFKAWDFEVVRKARNGDLKRPFCRNKIASFSRDPEGKLGRKAHGELVLQRLRAFIVEESNKALEAAGLITRYHPGPLSDLGITITKTKKLGGAKMARERQGFHTDGGTENAKAIWSDREAKIEAELQIGLAANANQRTNLLTLLQESGRAHNTNGMRLRREIEDLAADRAAVLDRRAQFLRAETAFAKRRSRAEAVLREQAKVDGRRDQSLGFTKSALSDDREACLADARQHLAEINRVAPTQLEWAAAEQEIVARERSCQQLEDRIRADLVDLSLEVKDPEVRLPIESLLNGAPVQPLEGYDHERIARLKAWLDQNESSVRSDGAEVTITAPQSIRTIIARHQDTAEAQNLIGLAVIKNLLLAGNSNRWHVYKSGTDVSVLPMPSALPAPEDKLLANHITNPTVQWQLNEVAGAQERERCRVVGAMERAEWVQQPNKAWRLVADDFPELWALVLVWQYDQGVKDALAKRAIDLKALTKSLRSRDFHIEGEQSPDPAAVEETRIADDWHFELVKNQILEGKGQGRAG